METGLSWRPGREAISHALYLGDDSNTVADGAVPAESVTEHSYAPASLNFATTYFWKVDEVGDAGAYAGDIWSFTTQRSAVVDDFESYNDDDNRIYNSMDRRLHHQSQRLDRRVHRGSVRREDCRPRRRAVDAAVVRQHGLAVLLARRSGRSTRPRTGPRMAPTR